MTSFSWLASLIRQVLIETRNGVQILNSTSNIKLGALGTRNGVQILNSTSNIKLGALGHGLGLKFQICPIQVVKSPPKVEAFNNLHHNLIQILILITIDMQCYNFVYSY